MYKRQGHALVGDNVEFVARRGHLGQTCDLNRDGRPRVLDLRALVVCHHAHAADGRACNDEIALMERTVLDEERRDRAARLIQPRLEDAALARAVRVGLELFDLGGQDDGCLLYTSFLIQCPSR